MTIESYLSCRDSGMTSEEIQEEYQLSEATVWTLELGYQCYKNNITLDKAVVLIKND